MLGLLLQWAGHWSFPVIAIALIIGGYFLLASVFPAVALAQRGAFVVALAAVLLFAFGQDLGAKRQKEKYVKQIAALEIANAGFELQQDALIKKGIADAAKLEQSAKDIELITGRLDNTIGKIKNRPIVGTGCEAILADQEAYFRERRASRKTP